MTQRVEDALGELYAAAGGPEDGVALAAVGSLARRELGPRSDVDLVLLHNGKDRVRVNVLAESLWYPLWDSSVRLDHSVRTSAECAAVAGRELSAGVGLLDLRVVAGDVELVRAARSELLTAWRGNARKRLPELLAALEERHETFGDAAYLLEPDLKEARGGFRDMVMLRALAATWLTDRPHAGVKDPYERLLDVRDALHLSSGRTMDRLLATEVDDVASRLACTDADELRRLVSMAARRIGHAVDLTSRAARQVLPVRRTLSFVRRERRPEYTQAAHGLIIHAGEVGLDRATGPSSPLLDLRAGALAAQRGLVLSPVTADNLGVHAPPVPPPWPAEARDAFFELLATGTSLLPVWESLDLAGCIVRWIPQWAGISAQPQYSPVHRHTVDRHSVQCVAEVQRHLTQVDRPDLLLLACLLHDIGKLPGAGARHAAVGAPIARRVAEALGLEAADVELVERLVREHLTLVELATRRDHGDPATVDALVSAVDGRLETLAMLRYLTEADAKAAGPAAWSPWRAQLVHALTESVDSLLVGDAPQTVTDLVDLGLARSVALDGRPRVRVESKPGGVQLVIAATDRLGLFSDTAGLLASHSVSVRSAVLNTVDGIAVNTWRVDKQLPTDLPDPALLGQELDRLEAGDDGMLRRVRKRESRVAHRTEVAEPFVELVPGASASAAVVELRTGDRSGLLFALGRALNERRLSIRSAHISTLAGQAIDTFYVTESDGSVPTRARSEEAVRVLGVAAAGLVPPAAATAAATTSREA